MKKVAVVVLALAWSILLAAVAPVMASKPTTVPCSFAIFGGGLVDIGKVWWTGDDTIIHVRGRLSNKNLIMPSPAIVIGTSETETDMDYNTKTGEGNAIVRRVITFFKPQKFPSGQPLDIPNPIGIGTLELIAVEKVTTVYGLLPFGNPVTKLTPGDYTGIIVATHGTGDFENAKLMGEIVGAPFQYSPGKYTSRAFIDGELTFHG